MKYSFKFGDIIYYSRILVANQLTKTVSDYTTVYMLDM